MRKHQLLNTVMSHPVMVLCASLSMLGVPAGAASAAAAPAPESTLDTVIVTAQKRPENVQDVPMSVSAFSGAQLERDNISSVADLARFVPGVEIFQSNNNRNSTVSIRNVGTAGTNPGTDQDVGIFIDGVYVPVAGPVYSELSDISTVEVLRGPQGTLYGRNTPVGAINVTTRTPTANREGWIDVQGGAFGKVRVTGFIGGAITDTLAGRLSAWSDKDNGYLTNIYDGTKVAADDKRGVRGRLRWTPTSEDRVDIIAFYSYAQRSGGNGVQVDPLGPGGIVFGYNPVPASFAASPFVIAQLKTNPTHPYVVPGKWEVNSAQPLLDQTKMLGGSIEGAHDISGLNATISDIFAYNYYFDLTPNQSPGELPLDLGVNRQQDTIKSTSNELRIVSNGKQFVDYVGGIYAFYSTIAYSAGTTIGTQANRVFPAATGGGGLIPAGNHQDLNYSQTTKAIAAYGQATVNVSDQFRVTGGVRFSDDKKSGTIDAVLSNVTGGPISPVYISNTGGGGHLSAKRNDKSTTWTLGSQYDIKPGVMVYVTAGSGFKDGGFNSRSAVNLPFSFNPETSKTYEAGVKSTVLDGKLMVNLDVFRMNVKAYQQSTLLQGQPGFVIGNAGNFRNQGVELDFQAAPISQLNIKGSYSYIPSKITGGADALTCDTTYPFAGSAPPASSGPYTDATKKFCNFNGLKQAYAPLVRWSLTTRWTQDLGATGLEWFASGSMNYKGAEYLDPSLDPRSFQSGYALYDASFGIQPHGDKWRVSAYIKNLTDKRYFVVEAAQTQAANISGGGTAVANGFIGWLGMRRTYGVDLSYRF